MIAIDLFAGMGWGLACQKLGISEYGIEIMPEAVATRTAAGLVTPMRDVWQGLKRRLGPYHMLIGSPPCQTFSIAGAGAGRMALLDVLSAIEQRLYESPRELWEFGRRHDPRTALVLVPLAYIWRDRPSIVVLEQVPPVLPVWQAYARVLEEWGYSVDVAVLNAEQYGVPQTRRRAILVARLEGTAMLPRATHSKYHARDKKRLDPGVLPWVSIADVLGIDGVYQGNQIPGGTVEYQQRGTEFPAPTVTSGTRSAQWKMRSNYGTGGDPAARGERAADEPAATITSHADRNLWVHERPSTTITASDIVAGPGTSVFVKGGVSRQDRPGSFRVTAEQAARIQTFPAGMFFAGKKTKQFLQIGNAVPPRLAWAILKSAIGQS